MECESISLDEIIIQLVQEHKCLYDKTDKDFKDTKKKKNVWINISENFRNLYCIDISGNIFLSKNIYFTLYYKLNIIIFFLY